MILSHVLDCDKTWQAFQNTREMYAARVFSISVLII